MIIRTFILCCFCLPFFASCGSAQKNDGPRITIREEGGNLDVACGNRRVLSYNVAPDLPDGLPDHYRRSGYLHPIYSPSGQVITDDFPVGHTHQHGVFTAWTNTTFRDSFVDFWNAHKGLALISHEKMLSTNVGNQRGGFTAQLLHSSLVHNNLPVLEEKMTVEVHDRVDVFVWELHVEQRNITDDTLFLNKHLYGGLGVRGSKHWNVADSLNFTGAAEFLTDSGLARDAGNHTEARWTAMFGDLPHGRAGLAVIPHPDNLRWPQPVRIHPEMPYFSVSPIVAEPAFIAPAATLNSRYRFVTFDGEPPVETLNDLQWK